jgi:hypothetical protein
VRQKKPPIVPSGNREKGPFLRFGERKTKEESRDADLVGGDTEYRHRQQEKAASKKNTKK